MTKLHQAALVLSALAGLTATAGLQEAHAQRQSNRIAIVSAMGGKCLDAEGGRFTNGTRLIGYECSGNSNQQFVVHSDGTIRIGGKCLDAAGGQGRDGDQVVLWDCHGGANQKWRYTQGQIVGINGKCIDLQGGRGHWFGNQPAILWSCHGEENQRWMGGRVVSRSRVASNATVLPPGQLFPRDARELWPRGMNSLIAAGGGNLIAAGGGNLIATGGGNLIAPGGGN